jgi:hypothetical protein
MKGVAMKRFLIIEMACVLALLLVPGERPLRAQAPPQGGVGSSSGPRNLLCGSARASFQESASELQRPWVGVYKDWTHSNQCVEVGTYQYFSLWLWWRPGSRGMNSAEFKLDFPANVALLYTESNPAVSVESGTLDTGLSIAFAECQTDWVWTQYVSCILLAMGDEDVVTVDAHPSTGSLLLEACDADHSTEWPFAFTLYINECLMCPPSPRPAVVGVTAESETAIRAFLDMEGFVCSGGPPKDHFLLTRKSDPTDVIHCISALRAANPLEWELTLERAMVDGSTYDLSSLGICYDAVGGNSKHEFTYHAPIATLLRSCSAAGSGSGVELVWELSEVDAGIEFFVSRSENGASFVPLDMAGLARDGLTFRYADSRVEPGKSYVYKVEYSLGGTSRLLFISEEIRTPAALLALYQNHPNPFNPSTTISFSLPAGCVVRLEVYDVSGRLVRRLIDGERRGAGLNDVEWNGRDASGGAAVSGIYVYRLVAGKETLSRKMVLLR